jgi:hypothetical protein
VNKKLFVWTALLLSGSVGAQVYRCDIGGKVTYTDEPCHSGVVRSVEVQGNSLPATRPALPQPAAPVGVREVSARQVPPPGSCPSETDIRNIHTRLSAKVIPAKNRAALYTELARAERCPTLGGRYSHEDWKRLQAVLRGDD